VEVKKLQPPLRVIYCGSAFQRPYNTQFLNSCWNFETGTLEMEIAGKIPDKESPELLAETAANTVGINNLHKVDKAGRVESAGN
jgi:hypothetical protein